MPGEKAFSVRAAEIAKGVLACVSWREEGKHGRAADTKRSADTPLKGRLCFLSCFLGPQLFLPVRNPAF